MGARRALAGFIVMVSTLVPLGVAATASATTADLFFSEYIEGGGFNKALEIYNGTGGSVDLSDYTVELYSNGSPTASQSVVLSGSLSDGDTFVIAHGSASPAIHLETDLISSSVANFNGNDAVVLRNSGGVIDVIGQVGFDPGDEWGSGLTSTKDNTLRRKSSVCAGDPDGSDAFDPSVEWDGYAVNTFDGLGSHTADCDGGGGATPVINEFVANHTGSPDSEAFVEVAGAANTDYSDLTVLEIEGDSTGAGVVDAVLPVGTTNGDGYWTDPEDMENGTLTILLVSGFTGAMNDDLDTDNDGTFDVTPWDEIVDGVAVSDGGGSDHTYAVTLDPYYDGQPFGPGGASRIPDRADTDTTSDWMRNDFDGAGFIGYFGTPMIGEAYNTPGAANEAIAQNQEPFGACYEPATKIHDVQGSGFTSPMAGDLRTIEGVVVGDFEGSAALSGFFLQEEDADADADPYTSEGIFVYNGSSDDVSLGDIVRVRGTVTEYFGLTELTGTTDLTVCATGGSATAATLAGPLSNFERETVEGMAVHLTDTLYVTDHYNLQRYGEAWLGMGGVIEQPTNEYPAGPTAASFAAANMERSILLDDGSGDSYPSPIPFLHANGTLRVGDSVDGLDAIMSYGFGAYRLEPLGSVVFDETNPRPAGPPSVGGDLVVGSANVLNFWTTIGCGNPCRGAQTAAQLAIQTDKLAAELTGMGADIIGLVEIENDPTHLPILTLVDAMNALEGSDVWAWVGEADHYNAYPIVNEIVYRTDRVTQVGTPTALADPSFDDTAPSGDPYARPPLAQTFEVDGAVFTVVVNHFKSKGSTCGEPSEGADGQGSCNLQRVLESEALLGFVDDLAAIDPDVLVIGDFNAYAEEEPILTLETELVNLDETDPYSYNFFDVTNSAPYIGRGAIDHAFGTDSMADQVTGAAAWHINADEPRFLDWYDPSVTAPGEFRASDHDPLVIGLHLDGTPPEVSVSPDELWPPNHKYRDVTVTVTDDLGAASATLLSVVSSEPDSTGKGDKPNDIVTIDDFHFQLRAESYSPEGRTYTITYLVSDDHGNSAIVSVEVVVPHDQGHGLHPE